MKLNDNFSSHLIFLFLNKIQECALPKTLENNYFSFLKISCAILLNTLFLRKNPLTVPNYESEAIAFFHRDQRIIAAAPSRRQAIWLATMLTPELASRSSFNDIEVDSKEMHLRIYEAIDHLPKVRDRLRIQIVEQLLPESDLLWVKNEPKQLEWLNCEFLKRPGRRDQLGAITPLQLSPRDEFILKFDLWINDRHSKRLFLEKMKESWITASKNYRILRWFDDSVFEKCDLLWDWLYKNKSDLIENSRPFKSRANVENFFIEKDLRPDEINHIISTVKLRWSQRKYRENKSNKKQFNFVMSTQADRSLDKLAKTRGLSRSQIVELLIHEESDRSQKKNKW